MRTATPIIANLRLQATVTAIVLLVIMGISRSHASDDGFYGGRSQVGGAPLVLSDQKAELAQEPGSIAVGGDTAHLDGGRIFGGYRFGSGFALEGSQIRFGAPAAALPNETLSVAGISSM